MQHRIFGSDWGAPVTEGAIVAPTPVGDNCLYCGEALIEGDNGNFVFKMVDVSLPTEEEPVHKECSLRSVMGGIGHLEDHDFWCITMKDPNGGRTYRQSALEVWSWLEKHGVPTV